MSTHFMGLVGTRDCGWEEALQICDHDFYDLPAYAEFCASTEGGQAKAFLYRDRDGTLVIPLLLLPIDGASALVRASSPYGYPGIVVARTSNKAAMLARALPDLIQCLNAANAVTAFIRLNPLFELPLAPLEGAGALVSHGETVSIDLASSLDESWGAMRPSHRRNISAALAAGFSASMDWSRIDDYVACYLQTMRRVSASKAYLFERDYVEGLRQALGERIHLCTVSRGSEVASAGLFSELNGIMQYHLGGTKDEFLQHSPMKLMFDFARRFAKERGNRVLHLGGGVGGQADALLHFKAGFSQRRHRFHTYRLVTNAAEYARLCQRAGVTTNAEGYFPPFIKAPE